MAPEQNGQLFTNSIFKYDFLNDNWWILIQIWLNYVPKGPIVTFGSSNGLVCNRWQVVTWN